METTNCCKGRKCFLKLITRKKKYHAGGYEKFLACPKANLDKVLVGGGGHTVIYLGHSE